MERYIPLFAVKVENGMEWNGTPFCRPMAPTGVSGAPGARPPIRVLAGALGAPGAQPPLRGALSFFPWKAPQCGVLEGFWTLSRQLSPGTRAPEGPWAFRAPHTQGPQGPQRGPGPLVSGAPGASGALPPMRIP